MKSLRALIPGGASSALSPSTSSRCAPSSRNALERRSTSACSLKILATFSADACWIFCCGLANCSSCCALHALPSSNRQSPPKVLSQPVALLRVSDPLHSPLLHFFEIRNCLPARECDV